MADPLTLPIYRRPAERRTAPASFRIYQDQIRDLRKMYGADSHEAVRLLLDELLKGRVPAVRAKMIKRGVI